MFKKQIDFQLKKMTKTRSLAIFPVFALFLFSNHSAAQLKVIDVASFDKVIVSPHIQVIFREGAKESVTIESIKVPIEKLNVSVKNNTLSVYLEGAKITTGTKEEYVNHTKHRTSIYEGTIVRTIITYKTINSLDLRGEERFVFESMLDTKNLRLHIYGESHVFLHKVAIQNLKASIYGESYLEIMEGTVEKQKFTAYGETKINTLNIENTETRLTAYGDGTFNFNVSKRLKITSYGEATINYSGSPDLNKGIVIGESKITKVNK
ncbi:head GIN domain-containing protein [Patiriisocius sp. Uisw_017]|jgi:hypothetical protein|uniref:head GIN domain-containing protein n=1 Tax=Patiriisocius sp. Uisw_017 TaxID=3230968 RepID=UPI0039EB68AA